MGAQGSTYSYNGDGTLVGQASGGVTTGYAQDLAGGQSQVLAIATGSGANAGTVDQLWGLDRLASLNAATGARAWYGYDGQGSARQLLNDAGHVTASANYDPYGGPEGAALPSPFGYTGELTDPATGSQYLRARWYRPGQGTLLGVDPALDSTGKPYSYASDNPVNGNDPSGRCTFPGGQLAGVLGEGSCGAAILAHFQGINPSLTMQLGANAAAFSRSLDQALAAASGLDKAGYNYSAGIILNPGQCEYAPGGCNGFAFTAGGAALRFEADHSAANASASRDRPDILSALCLGTPIGLFGRIGIVLLLINGVLVLGVAVWGADQARGRRQLVVQEAGFSPAVGGITALGLGAAATAGEETTDIGCVIGGLIGCAAGAIIGLGIIAVGLTTYHASQTAEDSSPNGSSGQSPDAAAHGDAVWSNLRDGMVVPESEGLTLAGEFLGPGYDERPPNSGEYYSQDGKRRVRLQDGDITGAHGDGGPHINFEIQAQSPNKPDKLQWRVKKHIYIK